MTKKEIIINFSAGDSVKIVKGPFANQIGVVDEIYKSTGKITVSVVMFGRKKPLWSLTQTRLRSFNFRFLIIKSNCLLLRFIFLIIFGFSDYYRVGGKGFLTRNFRHTTFL
ncbi:MAG: KOW motif-containing protein [Clostridiales bacterium]|nr:MAG: KOW motif-containing protein [Clostridiales bacterium]